MDGIIDKVPSRTVMIGKHRKFLHRTIIWALYNLDAKTRSRSTDRLLQVQAGTVTLLHSCVDILREQDCTELAQNDQPRIFIVVFTYSKDVSIHQK